MSKYDPAERDENGRYTGADDIDSDRGPVEAGYLAVVAAFAKDSGVDRLQVREPGIAPTSGLDLSTPGDGLRVLFGHGLAGYHDGAEIEVDTAIELVRLMLREDGTWCRLEAEDRFFVHVGWDQYLYIGSRTDCPQALAVTRTMGLYAEPIPDSPHSIAWEDDGPEARPADAEFWEQVTALITQGGGAVLLEEGHLANTCRWHRLTTDTLPGVRSRLAPRARLLVWPDLDTDVTAALAGLPEEGLVEVVWQDHTGTITSRLIDETDQADLRTRLVTARAASILPAYADERQPLLAAVLPDPDGRLRARWKP